MVYNNYLIVPVPFLLLIAYCLLLIAYCLLFTVYCLLFFVLCLRHPMRIFFAGPLTDLKDPEATKAFYIKLADVATKNGFAWFWAFLNGTDPIKNPDVTAHDVYVRDITELEHSDLMVAYVGEPTTGTGLEIEHAYIKGIPVYLLYEKSKRISRMLRGCPAIKKELVYEDESDALAQLDALLKTLS